MLAHHTRFFDRCSSPVAAAVFSVAIALAGTQAFAQEDTAQTDNTVKVMDEMVVTAGPKSGDPIDLDALYEEEMRDRFMRDQEFLRDLEEEDEWRKSVSTTAEGPGRMQWGYSAVDERRMQREQQMQGEAGRFESTPTETVKPATVFRVGF